MGIDASYPRRLDKLHSTTLAWAAGIVDGDGCMYINRLAPHSYSLRLRVAMCDRQAPAKLHRHFAGSLILEKTRPIWCWEIAGYRAGQVIEALSPYLVTKAREAQVAIRFTAYMTPRYRAILTPKEVARCRKFKARMAELKRPSRGSKSRGKPKRSGR